MLICDRPAHSRTTLGPPRRHLKERRSYSWRGEGNVDPLGLTSSGRIVRVDQRCLEVTVPHPLLQGSHGDSLSGELRSEGMAKVVETVGLGDAGGSTGLLVPLEAL